MIIACVICTLVIVLSMIILYHSVIHHLNIIERDIMLPIHKVALEEANFFVTGEINNVADYEKIIDWAKEQISRIKA